MTGISSLDCSSASSLMTVGNASTTAAMAGVLVSAPVNVPAPSTLSMGNSMISASASMATITRIARPNRLWRMPVDLRDAKNSGPDSRPIVYTNSARPTM